MKRKKILLCNESSFLNSGYANYGRELLRRLYETDKYDIAELGCYGTVNDPRIKDIPWRYYPNSVDAKDPRYPKYTASTINQFGHWRFDIVCLDFKPDIVFDIRDPWMFDYQSASPLRKFFKWVIMPAMDSIPQKIEWLTSFNTADILVPYTNWAKYYLKDFKNLWHSTTPAGIDTNIFKPGPNRKEDFGIPKNSFVIGSVMRNQRRKLIPALFEVVQQIRKTKTNTILYLHTTFPEMSGWNIPSLLADFELANFVYFTYKCKNCKHYYASKFVGPQTFCVKCGEFASSMSNTMDGITDREMADIYNLFDIYIQYAICEGFGMPQVEAAACGVPVMSVDYSAMSEVVRNLDGFPIPISSLAYEIENHAKRAYPDIDTTIKIVLDYIHSDRSYKNEKKIAAQTNALKFYNWDHIAKTWENIFDNLDISDNADWALEPQFKIDSQIKLDMSLNNFELLEYICVNVIKDESLLRTNFIQTTLAEMDYGIQKLGTNILPFNRKMALDKIEQYTNTKAFLDNLRTNPNHKIAEDYILKANNK